MNTSQITVDYTLDAAEVDAIKFAASRLASLPDYPVDPAFYDHHWDAYHDLPSGLRCFLEEFRRDEPAAACLIRGIPVDDACAGPTPGHWETVANTSTTPLPDLVLALCGLALGEPFSWGTLQFGQMIQNVFPIRGDEKRLSGHGSTAHLVFHTDDAFHPDSCDYLMLLGIRNHERVPTFVASVRDAKLTDKELAVLCAPRYFIVPDDEHIRQLELRFPGDPMLARAIEMRDAPRPVPVLFGSPAHPYLRLDGPFMHCAEGDTEAAEALASLHAELDRVQHAISVDAGTLLILDNHMAAHGRQSFTPRYDGTDRWLRKLIVSRNLRQSRTNAPTGSRRVLF
jgi:L-asparagine oxygenase